MNDRREAAEQAGALVEGTECEHETPGGARYCALCREEVLRLHEGYERMRHRPLPTPTTHVPMTAEVRAAWARLREPVPRQGALFGDEAGENR